MSRVAVFGGSFDPVHVGHLAIAIAAIEAVPLDQVLFVPARRSPLKDGMPAAAAHHRAAMLERAIVGEPRFALSRLELERAEPSYTVDTLEALAGGDELFLLVGADAFADFSRWHRVDRIRALARVLIAGRPGAPAPADVDGAQRFDAPLLDISSRELRARAARGRSLRYLVPDDVWTYIREHGLYAEGAAPRTS